ncbi:hypothetical protein LIER_19901 [Lithospermum erythrorhizon]|uniref:Retrotransposon gag domain-containing protein n=1 Tax=Lithospermum erythrorhizon TaxID=34254 RepID=A0AAV3QMI5_LITER
MALCAKEKLGFIDGRFPEPELLDPFNDRWKMIECMVSSWILNSISPGMKEQFMFTNTIKKLWDEIISRYGVCNGPLLYQLKREMTSLTQGSMSLVIYYSKLKRIWDELNELEPRPIYKCIEGCPCDLSQQMLKKNQDKKLMEFLLGLISKYDAIKDQIMMMDPWPSVSRAYSMVSQVEQKSSTQFQVSWRLQRGVLQCMLIQKPLQITRSQLSRSGMRRKASSNVVIFGMKGHLKEACYRLHGFPEIWQ